MRLLSIIILCLFPLLTNSQSILYRSTMAVLGSSTSSLDTPSTCVIGQEGINIRVIADTINDSADWAANTGLSYDKQRRLIYSAVTKVQDPIPYIRMFNEEGSPVGIIPIQARQGFFYDHRDSTFTVWSTGNLLRIYDYSGTQLSTQSFDPYGDSTPAGSLALDYTDNKVLASADGGRNIIVFRDSSGVWVKDSEIVVGDAQEGVAYDEISDTYWYRTTDQVKNIQKNGTLLRTINQPAQTALVNEGLAFNPHRNSLYINSDKYFHGFVPDGNRCVEIYVCSSND